MNINLLFLQHCHNNLVIMLLGSIDKKTSVTLSGFWPLGGGGLSESVKKGKFVTKIFF